MMTSVQKAQYVKGEVDVSRGRARKLKDLNAPGKKERHRRNGRGCCRAASSPATASQARQTLRAGQPVQRPSPAASDPRGTLMIDTFMQGPRRRPT